MNRRTWQKVEQWWARRVGLRYRAARRQGDRGTDVAEVGHPFAYEVKAESQDKARSAFSWAFVRETMIQAEVNARRQSEWDGESYRPAVVLVRIPGRGRPFATHAEHAVIVSVETWVAILEDLGYATQDDPTETAPRQD